MYMTHGDCHVCPSPPPQHLNRQVVRADSGSLTIRELDFEVPAHTQKGGLTTVESILTRMVEGLVGRWAGQCMQRRGVS